MGRIIDNPASSRRFIDLEDNVNLTCVVLFYAILDQLLFIVIFTSLINDSYIFFTDCLGNDFITPEKSDDSFEFVVVLKTNVASISTVYMDLKLHLKHKYND